MDYGVGLNSQTENFAAVINIEQWLIYLLIAIVVFCLLLFAKIIIKELAIKRRHQEQVIFLVRLPKDKPKEKDYQIRENLQNLREEIAKGETIFSSIGGLRAERGFKPWLLGRSDNYSFEIVASEKLISFYIVAPKRMERYIEQQITAYYPEAFLEVVPDYNIFSPKGKTVACQLCTQRHFIFPLKTYTKMESDPLNSLVNVMSKLDNNEGMAIQYVVRSAKGSWHGKINNIVSQVNQGKKIAEVMNGNIVLKILSKFGDLVEAAKPPVPNQPLANDSYKLTAMEQEMLKLIEEKNSKSGLDVNLRIIVNAQSRDKALLYINNVVSAYSEYNYYQYGNIFRNKYWFLWRNWLLNQNKIINNFIYRRFDERISFLLNTEELTSLFHLPLPWTETPNIAWLTAKHSAAPANTPAEGIELGRNIYRGISKEIKLAREDRRRHTYMIGKSGVGKSHLLASMAIQDINNGEGVCVIDPHGDLVEDILERIPPHRAEDVILFAPADIERPLALNLLEFDPRYPEQKTFVINEMIKIFDKLYDLKSTGGPIFEQYMRNAMLLVMGDPESGSTLMEIPKVLSDADFRKLKLEKCHDQTVVDFWRKEAEKAGGDAALANVVPYITSKLTSFISNDMMRPIIGQQKSSFVLRDIMDRQKILLVSLPKGLVGELNAYLLGMILVGKILIAALSRTDVVKEKRKDFYLYIDEFQNFTTDSICSILSEARKYNLNLIIAHQYLGQLVKGQDSSIKDAVFGNVGTWLLFKIGSEDAQVMEKEFAPVFNQYDLINIEKYCAYVKLLVENTALRPFSINTYGSLPGTKRPEVASDIKSLSRLKYGQDRHIIEAQIFQRGRIY